MEYFCCRFADFPLCDVELAYEGRKLYRLNFRTLPEAAESEEPVGFAAEVCRELREYFAGERHEFTVEICLQGTPFMLAVFAVLLQIPYGETRSYGEIAAKLGNKKASRAVGGAVHRNPLSIFIPCHRVIGGDGSLTGYAGSLPVKKFLLDLECRHS